MQYLSEGICNLSLIMDTRSESFIETSIEYSRLCSAGLQNLIIIIFCSYGPLLSLLLQKLRGHVVHTK